MPVMRRSVKLMLAGKTSITKNFSSYTKIIVILTINITCI